MCKWERHIFITGEPEVAAGEGCKKMQAKHIHSSLPGIHDNLPAAVWLDLLFLLLFWTEVQEL